MLLQLAGFGVPKLHDAGTHVCGQDFSVWRKTDTGHVPIWGRSGTGLATRSQVPHVDGDIVIRGQPPAVRRNHVAVIGFITLAPAAGTLDVCKQSRAIQSRSAFLARRRIQEVKLAGAIGEKGFTIRKIAEKYTRRQATRQLPLGDVSRPLLRPRAG